MLKENAMCTEVWHIMEGVKVLVSTKWSTLSFQLMLILSKWPFTHDIPAQKPGEWISNMFLKKKENYITHDSPAMKQDSEKLVLRCNNQITIALLVDVFTPTAGSKLSTKG